MFGAIALIFVLKNPSNNKRMDSESAKICSWIV